MHLAEIYNQLLAGETLKLKFYSTEEAVNFRIRLAQFKSRQEKEAVGIGFMMEEEVSSLSFHTVTAKELGEAGEEVTIYWATLVLKQRSRYRQYDVIILPRNPES